MQKHVAMEWQRRGEETPCSTQQNSSRFHSKMLAAGTRRTMPEGATALEIPANRPNFASRLSYGGPPPATAVFLPPERLKGRRAPVSAYLEFTPDPEMEYRARRYAYAYITPAEAPCRAEPGPFIRLVFRTLALDLPQTFELLPPQHGADATVRFRTPGHREAAMGRQPFVLDGATVKLLRDGETPDVWRVSHDYVVHLALHDYPVQKRTEKKIQRSCRSFGFLREIDPACFAAPDLATVHVVVQNQDPGVIAHELRIEYRDGSINVVPVQIVRVWHRSHFYNADGQYVPIFQHPAVAACSLMMDLAPKSLLC